MNRRKITVDDSAWPEVSIINNYAIFMGYLLMGVRGLGFLVFTWTTVVLLGGFVSTLQKKDFWCLTVITLVQTVGWGKANDVGNSLKDSLAAIGAAVFIPLRKYAFTSMSSLKIKEPSIKRKVVATAILVVQVLVLSIVLFPLAVLHVYGLYVSTGISLWRLIQHDYSNPDGGANLKPALNVLYSLAVAQGLVHIYRIIYYMAAGTRLHEVVANHYSLENDLVFEYLEETMAGCMKDPSFASGRNLVTYGMDLLMESKSRDRYTSGVLILGKIHCSEQRDLLKQLLLGSASFNHVLQQLLETFGPTSPYSKDIMVRAAGIVATVADRIRVEQFPAQGMMIQCISYLLDTFEDKKYEQGYLDNDSETEGYKSLVMQGLCILQGLAVNEENCRVITNTQGLLSKAMKHLVFDKLHRHNHDEWSGIAEESLEFINQMMATLGRTTEIRSLISKISRNRKEIMRTLECHKCHVLLKRQAAQVLLQLPPVMHMRMTDPLMTDLEQQPSRSSSSSIIFVWTLLDIFLLPDYHLGDRMRGSTHLTKRSSDIARLAGEKMQATVPGKTEQSDMSMQSVIGAVIGSLARTVAGNENNAYRIHAARILRHLCEHYSKDDENLKELKKAMVNVMEEVLREIVHWHATEEIQSVTEANNGSKVIVTEGPDIEQGGVPHDNGQEGSSTPHQPNDNDEQHQGIQLQKALVDLCWAVSFGWNRKDKDLTRQFNQIAAKICSDQGMPEKTFTKLVGEARDKLREEEERASILAAVRISYSSSEAET